MPSPRAKKAPRPKKTAFVPRGIFVSALSTMSVIPVCACGGSVAPGGPQQTVAVVAFEGGDGGSDGRAVGVALDAFIPSVAVIGFDARGDTTLGLSDSVGASAFDGSDAPFGDAEDAFVQDAPASVALQGFDGSIPPRQCVPTCASDMDCQATCPIVAGEANCCDTGAEACFTSATGVCPQ